MKYTVILYRSEEGITVSVAGLPGCWSEGDTEEEALENIQDAIREYLTAVEAVSRGRETREIEVVIWIAAQNTRNPSPWRRARS